MSARFVLPPHAAWRHRESRDGFEVVFFHQHEAGLRVEGHSAAVECGDPFAVRYAIEVDAEWRTRWAQIEGWSASGARSVAIRRESEGSWLVDGAPMPQLDGCLDVDLESSALTNAFPIHRLGLSVGEEADAPAVYVRAQGLGVERLEQHYTCLAAPPGRQRYGYVAPAFDFRCEIAYDEAGLVLDYPGIATRADCRAAAFPNGEPC